MTNKKRWWIEMSTAEARPGLYLHDTVNGRMKVKGTKSGALFPAISGMERLPRSDKAEAKAKFKEGIKVRCGDGDEIRKVNLDKAVFDHTKSAFSKQFANMSTDDFIEAVLNEVNNVKEFAPGISSTPTSRTSSPGTPTNQQSSGGSSASMTGDVYSFDEGDTAVPEETPKKRAKRTSPVADIKGLRSSTSEKSTEDKHRSNLKKAVIDEMVSVNLCQLNSGESYLREVSDEWMRKIKASMIRDPLYRGAPLVAIANKPRAEFDPTRPNAFRYTVIGGCHRLKAAKELASESRDVQKTMAVQVYGSELLKAKQTISWWANTHNELQNMQRKMKTQDQVIFCRKEFMKKDEHWKARCKAMLGLPNDHQTNTILNLAQLDAETYRLLLSVYSMYKMGELKDSKLSKKELESGADCKPHHFQDFVLVQDPVCQRRLLSELVNKEKTLKKFSSEAKEIKRRHVYQTEFVHETNCKSWEEAVKLYPAHTTTAAMDRLSGINFKRSAPEAWKSFVESAKKSRTSQEHTLQSHGYTKDHCRGYLDTGDFQELTKKSAQKKFPGFDGADLLILGKDDISVGSLPKIIGNLRQMNLECSKNQFLAVVFLPIKDVGPAMDVMKDEVTYMEAIYVNRAPGKLDSGKSLLHSSVEPALVMFWSASNNMPTPVTVLVERQKDMSNMICGKSSSDIMEKIIKIFSFETQWVMAANMKHGATTLISALGQKRSCIQLISGEEVNAAHTQINSYEEIISKSSSTSPENGKPSSSPPENGKPSSSPPENGKPSSSPPDNEKSSSSPPDNEKSSSSPPDDSADDSDAGSDNSDEDDESEEEVSEIKSVRGGEGEAEVAESISDDQGPERDPESNDTGGSLTQLDDAQRQETEDDDALDGQ